VNPLLIALLGVILIPLFISSWRASLLGLACQGGLMALLRNRLEHGLHSPGDWLALLDLAVIRGLLAPLALYGVLHARHARPRNDVIPPDLVSWTAAIAIVLVSFSFAGRLVETPGDQQTLVAVASAGLMLGFLVLATRADPLSQVIGALRLENAIALVELDAERHESHVFVQLGLVAVFAATVLFFAWYLSTLSSEDVPAVAVDAEAEGPTL
jgi:hydrogenase-4 membrane subunit HyfE